MRGAVSNARGADRIDAGIGGELGILIAEDALEHELDLDGVTQSLDRIPGQVGDGRAADAAEM